MSFMSDANNIDAQMGYELIGKVAVETRMPEDDMFKFIMNLIKIDNVDPKTLDIEQLRTVVINYIDKIA